jgi:hypothetical protein
VFFWYVEGAYSISRKSRVKFLQSIISSPVLRSRSIRVKRKKDKLCFSENGENDPTCENSYQGEFGGR